ncbi:unnamed protein product [Arabis nemorensis]|uniref:F-box/LRR-repeat protein 15/At3g58940/PEG3-like LRR domain-containing protein n=1 Tax=Arabis nemorensis TaxID=586526 RepID=A0A565BYC2_9BRAS|nr:unnamed protein product [Arabis nemorensis]
MDRISNLPDEILCHIGSFLSAKEAAFTKDFVDGVLALPASSRIRNFSIKWQYVHSGQYVHVNRCLCDVLKRGVLVLELKAHVKRGYSLPLEVFTCKTVEKLTLGSDFAIDILPNDALLPALKSLFLDSIRFYDFGAFTTLLSASPLLEELVMDGIEFERWKWSWTVSSPTLRRLTIRRQVWEGYADEPQEEIIRLDGRGLAYDFDSISFDLPGLTYLDYSDYVPKEYLIVNRGRICCMG